MKSCMLLLLGGLVGILSLFVSPGDVWAGSLFEDHFSSIDTDRWTINVRGNGRVTIEDNSILRLSSSSDYFFPYVYLNNLVIPDNNYSIEIKYRISGEYNYGSGIIFSDKLLPYNGQNDITLSDTIFQIWPDAESNIWVNSAVCEDGSTDCSFPFFNRVAPTTINEWNTLKIVSDTNNRFYLYINNNLEFVSTTSSSKIKHIWFGNPERTITSTTRTTVDIDYLSIFTNIQTNTNPVIVIPGLGASWDLGAILSGTDGSNWQIPSFVNNYDGLKSSLINAGYSYTEGRKLYTFAYDWRKPLDVLADRLDAYIETNIPSDEKVDLVGHSMGGLVARAYAQKHGVSRINKIAEIGSPNLGSAEAYSIWEGATLLDDTWWTKLALELTTHFGANPGESKIQTIQRVAPSIKDLLPTTPFLSQNDSLIPWSEMNQKNTNLAELNQDISLINPLLKVFYSKDKQTKSTINVIAPSTDELAAGMWVDGKPTNNPFSFVDGDGTVTESSAKGSFTNTIQGSGWHGELVTKEDNLKNVFDFLGLDQTKVIAGSFDSRKNVLVAALRSPGKLEVCNFDMTLCNSDIGIFLPDNDLFILPGYSSEKLILKVTEDEGGEYAVHLGDIGDEADWKILNGNLQTDGQVDYYNIGRDGENITFEVDKTGPSVPQITGFHNPELACGGATNQHNVTVDWTDSTDTNGVSKYLYNIDYPINGSRSLWNASFQLSQYRGSLNEGVHYIKVRAEDRFGNLSDWSNICSVTADWTAPKVTITSPVAGTYNFRDLPKLKFTATDNLDTNLEVSNTGLPKSEGTHTVTVTAKDDAGNIGSASVTYMIKKDHLRDVCKKNGWRMFGLFRYRNQGECEKYFDRLERIYEMTHRYTNIWSWR